MAELPTLFLAAHCTCIAEVPSPPNTDELIFEPGFLAFEALCQVLVDGPLNEPHPLQLIDGPRDPVVDEGFQLFRINDNLVRRLASSTAEADRLTLAHWFETLRSEFRTTHELSLLGPALSELTALARRGESSGKALFLLVLFR